MNVLIVEGDGTLGAEIGKRFFKEGYKVYSIAQSLDEEEKVNYIHKKYTYDLIKNFNKYEEIFKLHKFDVVVYLSPNTNFNTITNNPLLKLQNVISLASENKIEKFIYISTTEVYEDNDEIIEETAIAKPKTIVGINALIGEAFLRYWSESNSIKIHILRVSTIYGGDFDLLNSTYTGENIDNKMKDYIYVGDVVDAIYKAVEFCNSFILNISSFTLCDSNYLDELIVKIKQGRDGEDSSLKNTILTDRGYSNKKAIEELNWVPKYSLQRGLKHSFKKANSNELAIVEKAKKQDKSTAKYKGIIPYLENILALIIINIIIRMLQENGITMNMDLNIIYISAIAIVYGVRQSLISIVLAIIVLFFNKTLQGHNFISLIYNPNTLLTISTYIFFGVVLGYIVDSKEHELNERKEQIAQQKEKFDFIYSMYMESKKVKNALEYQIQTSEDSFGKIYKVTSALNNLKPEKIYNEAIFAIEEITKNKSILLFTCSKDNSYLRLMAKSKYIEGFEYKSIDLNKHQELLKAINSKELFVNKDMETKLPAMMCPIVLEDRIIGVVAINEMSFDQITLYNENILRILTNLIASAFEKAYIYDTAISSKKYIENTTILKPEYFEEVIKEKEMLMEERRSEHTVLKIVYEDIQEAYLKIISKIRDRDYLGLNEAKELFVLLSNTNNKEADYVVNRLKAEFNGVEVVTDRSKYIFTKQEVEDKDDYDDIVNSSFNNY